MRLPVSAAGLSGSSVSSASGPAATATAGWATSCSSWMYLPPRSTLAIAASAQAPMAKSNAACSPFMKGPEMRWGKKARPVR